MKTEKGRKWYQTIRPMKLSGQMYWDAKKSFMLLSWWRPFIIANENLPPPRNV